MSDVGKGVLGGLHKVGTMIFGESAPIARVAPVPDDLAAQKKRQKDVARKYAKSGRAGTMLSSDKDKIG